MTCLLRCSHTSAKHSAQQTQASQRAAAGSWQAPVPDRSGVAAAPRQRQRQQLPPHHQRPQQVWGVEQQHAPGCDALQQHHTRNACSAQRSAGVATLECHRERSPALSFDQPDTQQVQQPCCYVALSAVRGCPPTQRRTLTLGAPAGQTDGQLGGGGRHSDEQAAQR